MLPSSVDPHSLPGLPLGLRSSSWTWKEDLRQRVVANVPRLLPAVFAPKQVNTCGILMYHRISDPVRGLTFPSSNVTPTQFRYQLSGLLKRGYTPWPLRRLLQFHETGQEIPSKVFAVTFDDGYANNFLLAYPILQELQIPATIFVCTAYLDLRVPFPFEDWSVDNPDNVPSINWLPLSSDQVAAMLCHGLIDIGSHSHTHRDFRNQPELLLEDLSTSLAVLKSRYGQTNCMFAFPYGKTHRGFAGPTLADAARRTGVVCGLTSDHELTKIDANPFTWGRIGVTQADSAASIVAKLDGRYAVTRRYFQAIGKRIKPSNE